ncbi:MAG: gliding motility-associated C-terminal domain-containing protein, partial [Saprospiraceae bacterium]|nr:gliding motility-associated C-terminal domain-containing protein [Saprospiraceae bacterium]
WQDGSTQPTLLVNAAGQYQVPVVTSCAVLRDTIQVSFGPAPAPFSLGNDTLLCPGDTLLLQVATAGAGIFWQDGSSSPNYPVTGPGLYSVTVTAGNGCPARSDTIRVDYHPATTGLPNLGPDTLLCPGDSLLLDATTPGATAYLWQGGSTQPVVAAKMPGWYAVQVSTACATLSDSVQIRAEKVPEPFSLGSDTLLCPGATLRLSAGVASTNYRWQDGSRDSIFWVTAPGDYAVTVSTACGSEQAAVRIDFEAPLALALRTDTFLCPGASLLLQAQGNAADFLWQDGSTAASFLATAPGIYQLTGSNQCESASVSVTLWECRSCQVYLPNIFSPNLDGFNDLFGPSSNCVFLSLRLHVFNRWGEQVYSSTAPDAGWDGRFRGQPAPPGVYVYIVQFSVEENGQVVEYRRSGDVLLMK